jgi:hypothetical protein
MLDSGKLDPIPSHGPNLRFREQLFNALARTRRIDEDEIMLYEKFKSTIFELDSLTNLSKGDIDEANEEVIGVKIDTFFSTINPKIVRVPKNKAAEIEELKIALKKKLSTDKTSNIAAVLNLLKELLQ